jgi:hypothetical protein
VQLPAGNERLQISSAEHGGIAVSGGPANQHEITLCKAVPERAGADLPAIRAVGTGSSVEVTGPSRQWVGYLLVRSPQPVSSG